MKVIFKLVVALLVLFVSVNSYAQNFTNKGKEFWVGYGHHQFMEPSDCDGNNTPTNDMNMVLYFSAEQAATVTVTIDNSAKLGFPNGWKKTYNILPNQVIQSDKIPKGSINAAASGTDPNFDARLFDNPYPLGTGGEGVWKKKGIHIVSNVPIVAYAHIYGSTASGATMLLPVETWGYSYTSINSAQNNATNTASWMYVIAKEDYTKIRVTPSQRSKLGKPANVPFTVDLMKGEIYQYIAQTPCSGDGPELTGTKIKSIVGADGLCHPIAVFSGSGRTGGEPLACGPGSRDNDMQQGFPEHAWGKRYLTAPFSKASGSSLQPSSFQTCAYKIITKEPGTTVKKNGVALSFSGNVYTYASSSADYIEADKPIMVAQFMGSGSCVGGSGDPEMVYLSPIEQAITSIGFYRNDEENIDANYLTLIVPTGGLSSLRIDNSQSFNHTYPHPNLPGYTVVIKGWAAAKAQCLVKCDSAFTAITYGLGGAESYGYNAGTYLKNLGVEGELYNKPDTSNTARPFTCTGTPMEISALIPYQPISMTWKLSSLGAVISPNADVVVTNPTPVSTVIIGLTTYYKYKLPGTYIFKTAGIYYLPIVNTIKDADNCGLQETSEIKIEVKQRPSSDFSFTHSGCRTDSVSFTGPSSAGSYSAVGWTWDFGDLTSSSVKSPNKLYGATGSYNVSLVVTSQEGCLSDTTKKVITIAPARIAGIIASAANGCEGMSIMFSDTTTITSGTFYWDFGIGVPVTLGSNTPQTITYPAPGKYIVRHVIHPAGNCVSDTVTKEITVYEKPAKPAVSTPITYCKDATAIPLSATPLTGHVLTWYDNTALTSGSSTASIPSTVNPGTFYYYVTQTSDKGCVSDTSRITVTIYPSVSTNSIGSAQTVCSGSPASPLTGSTPTGGFGTYEYQWQSSSDGGTTWLDISGATAKDYNPGLLNTGITQFRRLVKSGQCNDISNVITLTVETNLNNYEIASSQTICEGTTPALLVGQLPTGGTGTYTYQWQFSADGINWTPVAGATAKDYQPGNLSSKTYFRRVTSGGNCPAISSSVTISINPTANGSITSTTTNICDYQTASVVFTPSTGNAPFNIQLLLTAPGGNTSIITRTGLSNSPSTIEVVPVNSPAGVYKIQLQSVSDNGGCIRSAGLNSITITVTAKPVVEINPALTTICKGTPVSLSATGANTYSWSPSTGLSSTTGTTVSANPISTTTYTVVGSTNGCTGTKDIIVSVSELPVKPVVSSPIEYCQDASATPLLATALPDNALTWYANSQLTGGTSAAPVPSTTTAGTFYYYATQTNANGCVSDTARVTVTIYPTLANNTITADQTLCAGTAVSVLNGTTITGGTGVYSYQWQSSGDGGATWTNLAGATSATYSPGVLGAGIIKFRRIVASGLCSSNSNVVTITVEANLSNYDISGNQTICEGAAPALLIGQTPTGGTGTYTYQWQTSTDGSNWVTVSGATSKDYQPTALTGNAYYRRIASGGICPAISSIISIKVNPIPKGSITGPVGICAFEAGNVTFTASEGTAPFSVQLKVVAPDGGVSFINQSSLATNQSQFNVIPANSTPGTYTITLMSVTDNSNCPRTTGLNTISILVTAKPVLTVSQATTICAGSPATLTVSGAATYSWSASLNTNTLTGNSVTVYPTTTTTYTVTGTTNGCSETAEVTVTVTPKPAKPTVTAQEMYCQNATPSVLKATATVGNTLTWFTNGSLTGGNPSAPTPVTAVAGTTNYYVTQKTSNGCESDAAVITVIVNPKPIVDFTMPLNVCMPNGEAVFTSTSTISDGSSLAYEWTFGDNSPVSHAKDAIHLYAASGTYPVKLIVSSPYGCRDSTEKTFSSFSDRPTASFDVNPDELCQGQKNVFTDKSTPTGTIDKWRWDFGDGTPVTTNTSPPHIYSAHGNFTVSLTVTNSAGCASQPFTKDVKVHLQPIVDAGPDIIVPEGTLVQLKATANDSIIVRFVWTPATDLSNPTILQPSLTVTKNQTYRLTATGTGGCIATDTVAVRLLKLVRIPNAFSPNGDGINDTWEIANLSEYPGAKVEVFNRWGQLVFMSNGYGKPWDGTYGGKPLPVATYYYVITLNNGFAPKAGSITIIK